MLPFHLSGLLVNLYELGEISAECLQFARPLSIAMTDFVIDPYALYSEQPFCFQIMKAAILWLCQKSIFSTQRDTGYQTNST